MKVLFVFYTCYLPLKVKLLTIYYKYDVDSNKNLPAGRLRY